MKKIWLLLLAAGLLAGCTWEPSAPGGRPAGSGDLEKLKQNMTSTFSALEMYAQDYALAYPDDAKVLVPKYIDGIPRDPMSGNPLVYQKTERGYLISATADYTSAGAAQGFPQMDQDGFFALRADDFPSDELPEEP